MDNRTLVIGGFYRHFKNKMYQVRAIAIHSETKEKMVVYQALYGDYGVYVRPYDMFVSEVDHEKYPQVKQKYRFEQVNPDGSSFVQLQQSDGQVEKCVPAYTEEQTEVLTEEQTESLTEGGVDPGLLLFLDAETYQEKLNTLTALQSRLTDNLINAMAASMEVEVKDGPMEERYQSLRRCIQARAKYECTRLR